MFSNLLSIITQNKNIFMFITTSVYILSLIGVLSGNIVYIASVITAISILFALKNIIQIKYLTIWTVIFYIGVFNTSLRLKNTDELLNIAPVNGEITGKVLSIPQIKDNKQSFYFEVNKIEYDGIVKYFKNEKSLVSLENNYTFKIYDSYKIRGRLSAPFRSSNPSQFDYSNYLRNYNAYTVFYGRNPYSMRNSEIPCYERISSPSSNTEKFLQDINDYRENILKIHSKYLHSPNLEILGGIVFGDDAVNPPKEIKQSFVNSGLLHILAASGMNVGFIATFFFLILNFFKINFKINTTICIAAVIIYILMTGLGASVIRAGIMLIFVLIGKLIDRDAHNIALLSFVGFLMLLYNPMYINDVGFQLSFMVTFGLLLTIPYLIKSTSNFINWCIGTITIPIIAQLWVIPIQIFYFNNISIYSVFANIMSVPILSIISFGGFISSLLSIVAPIANIVCRVFDFILNPLISILINLSDFWGNLPNSVYQTTHPHFLQIIIYYLILLILTSLFDEKIRTKYLKQMLISLVCLIFAIVITIIPIRNENLEIIAFNMGNADAFLIKTPDNKYTMIDTGKSGYNGGSSQAKIVLLKYFKDKGIKNIENLIITHFDNDHCGGAKDIILNIKVKNVYANSLNHGSETARNIYFAAGKRNTKLIQASQNQKIYKSKNLEITNFIANKIPAKDDNENSIITAIKYDNFNALFMGDAGIIAFNTIKQDLPQNITLLKVGHHGAIGVINKQMADYLKPKYSLISTGENKFGHPSVYTIETLKNAKSEIIRTDINNAVKFIINNNTCNVYTYDSDKRNWKQKIKR